MVILHVGFRNLGASSSLNWTGKRKYYFAICNNQKEWEESWINKLYLSGKSQSLRTNNTSLKTNINKQSVWTVQLIIIIGDNIHVLNFKTSDEIIFSNLKKKRPI